MTKPTIVMMIDGLDPEYLEACSPPGILELGRRGFSVEGKAMMPTVTNVNNVSLVTANYPEVHGITSNYWFNRAQGNESYMESGDFVQSPTMFQRAGDMGARSLLITAKNKLRRLLSNGATLSVSSEEPQDWVVELAGEPPPIYSLEVNKWAIDTARHLWQQESFDLVYIATTDYAMHTFAPEEPESARHIALLDQAIIELVDAVPEARVLITADHGMSAKDRMVHLPEYLSRYSIEAQAVPIIKDRYTVHHSNLGGCIYLYLKPNDVQDAVRLLSELDGVDEALPREQAASKYHLLADRIGDIMVMASADTVFGDPSEVTLPQTLRSHGSLHEETVPIIGYGDSFTDFKFEENLDLGRYVFERVLS